MAASIISLIMGAIFGASLVLAGLTDPDKIIGSLRLKDLHALRTVVVAVLVAMIGAWLLDLGGAANFDIKPAVILPVLIGGAFVGIGLGLTGFCAGNGLACAASGRIDALAAVVGMFVGAHVYILIYPSVVGPLEKVLNYGPVTLPQVTGTSQIAWVVPALAAGSLVLILTRPPRAGRSEQPNRTMDWGLTQDARSTRSQVLRADDLELVGVFRAWKNSLFVIAVLCLLLLQTTFWLVHTGQVEIGQPNGVAASKPVPSTGSEQTLSEVEGPKALGMVNAGARVEAQRPEQRASRLLAFDPPFKHIVSVIRPVNAILVLACVLYGLTTFFALTVSIAAELGGLGQIARAFYLSVIVLILVLPWQMIFAPGAFGTIYTLTELAHSCTTDAADTMQTGLFYLRFSGLWALTVLVLVLAQWRTRRWTQAALH